MLRDRSRSVRLHLLLLSCVLSTAGCASRAPAESAPPVLTGYEGWSDAESGALRRLDVAVRARLDSLGVDASGARLTLETLDGGGVRVQLVGDGMPPGMPGIEPLVASYLASRADTASVLLAFRLDGAPLGRVLADEAPADATLSPPRAVNVAEVARFAERVAAADPSRRIFAGVKYRPVVEMLVGADGDVAMVEVAERSGSVHFDAYTLGLADRLRFEPARLDGRPVSVLVSMPVAFVALPPLRPGPPT